MKEQEKHVDYRKKHYAYFANKECEYFPCHKGADPDDFNCLFCYCPLYVLGSDCGGNPHFLENGIKDCSDCLFPHMSANYPKVTEKYEQIKELMQKMQDKDEKR